MAVSPRQLAALLRCVRASSSVSSPSWLSAPRTVSLIGAPHAYGQPFDGVEGAPAALELAGRKIAVTGAGRTSVPGVWAGGDCAAGGNDLTVTAVAEGRDAAEDIHSALMAAP